MHIWIIILTGIQDGQDLNGNAGGQIKKEIVLEYLFKIFNLDVVDGLSSRTESPARRRSIYKMYIPTLIV